MTMYMCRVVYHTIFMYIIYKYVHVHVHVMGNHDNVLV